MRTEYYFRGCLLLACLLPGCGRQSGRIGSEAEAAASETDDAPASDLDAGTPSKSADEFLFPPDRGGQMLANQLRPANHIPPLPNEKPLESKRRSSLSRIDNPDLSLPPVVVPLPPSIPLAKIKPVRPTLVEGEPPLSRQRLDLGDPAPVRFAAGPNIAWPSPDVNQPMPLPILARPVPDRASLDDPSSEASQAAALATKVPDRTAPAPFLRLTLPDPFEHRNTVRMQTPPPVTLPIQSSQH